MTSSLISVGKILSTQKSLISQHLLHHSQDVNPLYMSQDDSNEGIKDIETVIESIPKDNDNNYQTKSENIKKATLIQNRYINTSNSNEYTTKSRSDAKAAIKKLLFDENGENEAQRLLSKLIGRVVEARESSSGPFSAGLIRCLNTNGTVVVDFIGTSTSREDVPVDHLRFPHSQYDSNSVIEAPKLKVGCAVEAQFLGRARWYPADIVTVHNDGTYDVHYSDNDKEQRISHKFIKHWMSPNYISFPPGSLVYSNLNSTSEDKYLPAKVISQHDDGSYTVRFEQDEGNSIFQLPYGDHMVSRFQIKSRRNDSGRGGLTAAAIATAAQYSVLRSILVDTSKLGSLANISLSSKKVMKTTHPSKADIILCDRYGPQIPNGEDDSDSAKLSIMNYPIPNDCLLKNIVFSLHHTPEGEPSNFQLMVFDKLPGSENSVENGGTCTVEDGKHEFKLISKHWLPINKDSKEKQTLQIEGKLLLKKGQYIGLYNPFGELRINYSMKGEFSPPSESSKRSVEVCFLLKSTPGNDKIETESIRTREWHGTTGWYAELSPVVISHTTSKTSSIVRTSDQLLYDDDDNNNNIDDNTSISFGLYKYISAGSAILRCRRSEVHFEECASASATISQACWMIAQMIQEEVIISSEAAKFQGLVPALTQICKNGLFLLPDRAITSISVISGSSLLHDSIRPSLESSWIPVLDLIQLLSNSILANQHEILKDNDYDNNSENSEILAKGYFSSVQSFAPLYLAMKKKADKMHITRLERKNEIQTLSFEFAKKDGSSTSNEAFLSSNNYRLIVTQYQKEDAWFHRLLRCLESLQNLMRFGEKLCRYLLSKNNNIIIEQKNINLEEEQEKIASSLKLEIEIEIEKNGDKVNISNDDANDNSSIKNGASYVELEIFPMKFRNEISGLIYFCVDENYVVRISKLPKIDPFPIEESEVNEANEANEDKSMGEIEKPVSRNENILTILDSSLMIGDILISVNGIEISTLFKSDYSLAQLYLHLASYGPIYHSSKNQTFISKPIKLRFGRFPLLPNFCFEKAIQLAKVNESNSISKHQLIGLMILFRHQNY